jgi:asparagine synthetase B (glutamine-hydrolysing)
LTNRMEKSGFTFIHNLLSMTGAGLTPQPFVSDDGMVVAMFNGEIYNYRDFGSFPSDGYCILPLYHKYRDNFVRHLDGEYAVVVFDFKRNVVVYSTDVFATKPLWAASDGKELGVSSYASPLLRLNHANVEEVPANTVITRSLLPPFHVLKRRKVHDFDLRQFKNDTSDWEAAFLAAIRKRIRDVKFNVFVSLSSGHDSGAVSLALEHIGKKHTTMTILGDEDAHVLQARREYLDRIATPIVLTWGPGSADVRAEQAHVDEFVEPYTCPIYMVDKYCKRDVLDEMLDSRRRVEKTFAVHTDSATLGHSAIGRRARSNNTLVLLSGVGGDEIMTDYGYNGEALSHTQSCLRGVFPRNLSTVFPWTNFFKGLQRAYLRKEEHVSGSHGIEVVDSDL